MTRSPLLLAALSALACTSGPPKAPPVDVAAEAATIQKLNADGFAAEGRKDLEAMMTMVTPDILFQSAGAGEIRGTAAMRDFYSGFFKLPIASIAGGSVETVVAASGDLAYDIGWNRMQMSEPKGAPADSGKYISIWRKVDGKWKIAAVAFSSNGPPKK